MELKFIKELKKQTVYGFRIRRIYELSHYKIEETSYGDDNPVVNVFIEDGKQLFLPNIETVYNFDDEIINFKINPAAYGSLSCQDVEVMIDSLNVAIETAKILIKKYVK